MSHALASIARGARRGLSVAAVAAGSATIGGWALERLLRDIGATDVEAAASMPGDDLLPHPSTVSTRAVTIAATPSQVWPWLVQIGWGRAGWYSLDAIERPLGAARAVAQDGTVSWRSLDHVAARHQGLAVGDLLPLRDGVGLRVVELDQASHLVVALDRIVADDLRLTWTWTLQLREVVEGTRLVARTRAASTSSLADMLVLRPLLGPGHAVMELAQLRGIRRRAEAAA